MEILGGVKTGGKTKDGPYPPGTLRHRPHAMVDKFGEIMTEFLHIKEETYAIDKQCI